MPYYESVFIARQEISTPQVESLTETFVGIISDGGGQVTKKEYWGLRNLAYRIKKNRKGHYMLLNIDAPSAAIQELERNMRINEDVLRYMTIRVDELDDGPSVMMLRRRDFRDEREGRRDAPGKDRRAARDTARAREHVNQDATKEALSARPAHREAAPSEESKRRAEKAAGEAGKNEAAEKTGQISEPESEPESEVEGEKA